VLSFHSPAAQFKVGLLLDRGGKDDKSFNSSAFAGATAAKDKLGIFLKYVEAADDNAFEPSLRAFAQRDFDLIIGIGFAQKDPIKKVAAPVNMYTNVRYEWLDPLAPGGHVSASYKVRVK